LEGVTVEEMLNNWHSLLPEYMQTWNLDRNEVRHEIILSISFFFESFRRVLGKPLLVAIFALHV
jgi:hypothetical protein